MAIGEAADTACRTAFTRSRRWRPPPSMSTCTYILLQTKSACNERAFHLLPPLHMAFQNRNQQPTNEGARERRSERTREEQRHSRSTGSSSRAVMACSSGKQPVIVGLLLQRRRTWKRRRDARSFDRGDRPTEPSLDIIEQEFQL